jgi:uncharacterized protein
MFAMTGRHTAVLPRQQGGQVHQRPRSRAVLLALTAAEGVSLAVLLGLDGSPMWRAVRVFGVIAAAAAAAWLVSTAGRTGRGAAALVPGIAGTVAGGGVASAHLAKAGPGVTVAVAGVALVCGVILLAWGAGALTRAMPGWWRLLAVPAGLAVLVFVLYPLTVAVYATNVPPGPLGAATPASQGLSYRDVAFRTADGVRLSAWYVPSRNGAAVVLLPGSGSTRTSLLAQAGVLARHGYGTLLLDTRGHGRSGGHAMDFGWYGDYDVAAAVSFLDRQPDVRAGRIAVLGLSMGGEQAIVAAGSDQRIRAVVAEGVTGEQLADHGWLPQGADGVIQRGLEWVMYTGAGLLSDAPRPVSIRSAAAAAAPRPVLIIAAGRVADEAIAARWFQAAAPSTVQVWVAPQASHTGALAAQPREWQARVTAFLDAVLTRS